MTLGLDTGDYKGGLSAGGSAGQLAVVPSYYGSNYGTPSGTAGGLTSTTFGISTDPEKSGIIADFSKYTTALVCIKY